MVTLVGAELLVGAVFGRRSNRAARRQQRQARKQARQAPKATPVDRAIKQGGRYYVRVTHFKPGYSPSSELKTVNESSYATARQDFISLRGWNELAALKGKLEYPEVIVYELWDNAGTRPVLLERWDTTMVDQGLKRQYIAMGL